MKIRRARLEDFSQLWHLERLCFKEGRFSKSQIKALLENPKVLNYIAKEKEVIIGSASALLECKFKNAKIISIAVHPQHRNKGVGKALMSFLEGVIKRKNIMQVELEVGIDNHAAINLYAALGYTILNEIKDYYSIGKHAYSMQKRFIDRDIKKKKNL